MEAFCFQARPWALRQAGRTYRHLPLDQRQLAVDEAMRELRSGAVPAVDRRTLYGELARTLTDALREVHAGWCLSEAQAVWRTEGLVVVPDEREARTAAHGVASFVEAGLVGLERAVLQLEIGAGRDTRSARAALKLGPRQYQRHREEGLSKLRAAIAGHAAGHVCEHHLDAVTQAATGDRDALEELSSGTERCRACAREAAGLRRVLQERLAIAPWPLAVKPAGMIAAKLGALGAIAGGGKSAGAGGMTAVISSSPLGTGAGTIATVLAAAALATGTAAVLGGDEAPTKGKRAPATTEPAAPRGESTTTTKTTTTVAARKGKAGERTQAKRGGTTTPQHSTATTPRSAATTGSTTTSTPAVSGGSTPKVSVREPVLQATDTVRKTVDPEVAALPAPLADPVQNTVDSTQGAVDEVTGAVDEVTGAVDGLLAPLP